MTIRGRVQLPTILNGKTLFIWPCKRIEILFCDWTGSSLGLKEYLAHDFAQFAAKNPQIEFAIGSRPGKHPILRGRYINGREKTICVRGMSAKKIESKLELLRNSSGSKLQRLVRGQFVQSTNDSVRGIWSPLH